MQMSVFLDKRNNKHLPSYGNVKTESNVLYINLFNTVSDCY